MFLFYLYIKSVQVLFCHILLFTNSNGMTVYSYYVFHVQVGFLLCILFQDYCYYFSSGTELIIIIYMASNMGSTFASDRLQFH